jgi:hypothetical protein
VAVIAWHYTSLVRQEDTAPSIPVLTDHIAATTVETVADLNTVALRSLPERDPQVLARRLAADIDDILRATADQDPARPIAWLGGSQVPLAGVLAHLLNELLIHGRDIARAARRPWVIAPTDAALFFDLFLVEILRYGVGCLLDNDEPPRQRRIAVEFRSHHTTPVTLVLHGGQVLVEQPSGDHDVRISFDPTTLNLMMFHRISQARAVLTGKVVVRGRRPWLLPTFLRTLRLP